MPTIRLDIALYWVTITVLLALFWTQKLEIDSIAKEVQAYKECKPSTTITFDEKSTKLKPPSNVKSK